MSISVVKGLVAAAVVATTGGAIAGYNIINDQTAPPPAFAEVLQATPITEKVGHPREVCEDVPVTTQQQPRDQHRVAGTATGALIGGVLGNQVGGGNGKKLATVAGAAIGGFTGNKLQKRAQANDVVTTMEQRCTMVTDYSEKVVGYDVAYQIGEEQGHVHLNHDPGKQIALVDGELVLGGSQ